MYWLHILVLVGEKKSFGRRAISHMEVAGGGGGEECAEVCPTRDVSFSRAPAKAWQAQKGRRWHAPHTPALRGGLPVRRLFRARPRPPGRGPRQPARCSLLFPVSSSLRQVLLGHSVQEMLQRLLPESVCPPSRWQSPNCQLAGGRTTWGQLTSRPDGGPPLGAAAAAPQTVSDSGPPRPGRAAPPARAQVGALHPGC